MRFWRRRKSVSFCVRTSDRMMMSFSPPWNESTVCTSMPRLCSDSAAFRALRGEAIARRPRGSGRRRGNRHVRPVDAIAAASAAASGLSLREKGRAGFVTPTEANVHGDALCFMGRTWATHKTTETVLNIGWRLAAVGGWRRLAVGGWWRLAVGRPLGAVLKGCP